MATQSYLPPANYDLSVKVSSQPIPPAFGEAVLFDVTKGGKDHIVIFYSFIKVYIGEPEQAWGCCS